MDEGELCPIDGEKNHWEAEDRVQYYCEKVAVRTPDDAGRIAQFHRDFDAWLIEVRKEEYGI